MNKILHPIEREELMAYLDGELAPERAAATAAHLTDCAECQAVVSDLRGVSQELATWKTEPLEVQIPQTIGAALETHKPKLRKPAPGNPQGWRGFLGLRWQPAWVGAVAVVILVVISTLTPSLLNVRKRDASEIRSSSSGPSPQNDRTTPQQRVRSYPPQSPGLIAGLPEQQISDSGTLLLQQSIAKEGTPPARLARNASPNISVANGPMIIRTAQLSLITKEFDQARAALETTLKRHRGYLGEMKAGGSTGSGRTLTATLRVPADQLDATLAELKTLGRVESESQTGQDVTSQYVDLQARLANARNTEQRLTDLLRNRTGKLSDVLEVEQEVDRVRGEIEQMEAERKNMSNQVSFATLNATITEDYKAQLQVVPPSTATRLSNAAVEGYRSVVDGVLSLALFLLSTGPTLLFWGLLLFLPARMLWKRVRRSFAE